MEDELKPSGWFSPKRENYIRDVPLRVIDVKSLKNDSRTIRNWTVWHTCTEPEDIITFLHNES